MKRWDHPGGSSSRKAAIQPISSSNKKSILVAAPKPEKHRSHDGSGHGSMKSKRRATEVKDAVERSGRSPGVSKNHLIPYAGQPKPTPAANPYTILRLKASISSLRGECGLQRSKTPESLQSRKIWGKTGTTAIVAADAPTQTHDRPVHHLNLRAYRLASPQYCVCDL